MKNHSKKEFHSYDKSLNSKENFAAFKIQLAWRENIIRKVFRDKLKKHKSKIVIYFSEICKDGGSVQTNTYRIKTILKIKKIKFETVD